MKSLLLTVILISSGAYGASYSTNSGKVVPGTLNSKSAATAPAPTTSPSGITNSSGIETSDVNTSPNPAPATEDEATKNTTLSSDQVYDTGPYDKDGKYNEQIEAQEDAMDYSTTPKKTKPHPKTKFAP